jgi:hypothetical protein
VSVYTPQTRQEAVSAPVRNRFSGATVSNAAGTSKSFRSGVGVSSATVVVANDFDPFHVNNPFSVSTAYDDQTAEDPGIRCFLYLDGHADAS